MENLENELPSPTTKQALHAILSRDNGMNMRLSTFVNWLDKMDCQVVVQRTYDGEEMVLDGFEE